VKKFVATACRMAALVLIVPLYAGCQIEKFNRPPAWASSVTSHNRFFGLKADIPIGGGSVVGVCLGWGSSTWTVIPVSTNKVYAAEVSDTFRIGQALNPFNTSITEDVISGWEGTPPPPRLNLLP
jgi:hypothetical protein